jgi:hypothetical protein
VGQVRGRSRPMIHAPVPGLNAKGRHPPGAWTPRAKEAG